MGGGGGGEEQKENSRKGKLNEKKKSYKDFDNEKNSCTSKILSRLSHTPRR